jgi:hypothetical protein
MISQKILYCMRSWLMHLLHPFGKPKMSRKESCASFLEESPKSSLKVEEEGSEEKSTFFFVEILPLLNLNYFSMSIKLLQEEFILVAKGHQLLV